MTVVNQPAIKVASPKVETRVTGEELLAMGDIGPCELVEGEIIKMSPTGEKHGIIEVNLGGELRTFVRQHKLGRVSGGETGIYIRRNPDTVRGADVVFISNERLARRGSSGFIDVAPDLVVEVMSPDDRWSDVTKKLEEYFSIGVRLVWVVDPESESVYAYRSLTDVRHFAKNDTLPGDDVLSGFGMSVADLFAD
jgi:Uma2 family endonuclease